MLSYAVHFSGVASLVSAGALPHFEPGYSNSVRFEGSFGCSAAFLRVFLLVAGAAPCPGGSAFHGRPFKFYHMPCIFLVSLITVGSARTRRRPMPIAGLIR